MLVGLILHFANVTWVVYIICKILVPLLGDLKGKGIAI
jgi:hypothetical protein